MRYFRMTVMFSVLTDGRQLTPSVSFIIKIYWQENYSVALYWNAVTNTGWLE
jgi:hypothetical protein